MIRKHTRRAAKAAFAIAFGVAIILGGATAATAGGSQADPAPIIIGTKNFGEAFVLGQLYKQALEAEGFDVSYKENIGSTELIQKALTSGRITMYPEYIGIAYTVTFKKQAFPKTALATYNQVKRLYGAKGYTLARMTPFQDVDAVAVLRSTARRYGLRAVADLKKVPDLTLAAFPEFRTRQTGLQGMKRVYGVTDVKFTPLAGISAYKLLDDGKVLAAGVFSTDPPLATTKYVVLKDPEEHLRLPERGADRLEEAGGRARPQARQHAEQGQLQADPQGDAGDEHRRLRRPEAGGADRRLLPRSERAQVARRRGTGLAPVPRPPRSSATKAGTYHPPRTDDLAHRARRNRLTEAPR